MNREISVHYTPELVRTAMRRFWLRHIGWPTCVGVCLVFAAFVYLLIAGERAWIYSQWGPKWFVIVMIVLGLVLVLAVVFITMCWRALREALAELAKRKSTVVVWQFTEDHMSTRSDLATAEVSWKLIQKVWRFPEVWLLFFSKNNYLTLPTQSIDQELGQLITAKVREHGGTVS